jgi:hypothetical protein
LPTNYSPETDKYGIIEDNAMKLFEIKGLDVKTYTPDQLAKKHKVSVEQIQKQLSKGIKVEKEHTSDERIAREIALDHLSELPDYYDRLQKAEA